jgi:hypothetical protein
VLRTRRRASRRVHLLPPDEYIWRARVMLARNGLTDPQKLEQKLGFVKKNNHEKIEESRENHS